MIDQSIRCPHCKTHQKCPEMLLSRGMDIILNCPQCHKQYRVKVWYQSIVDGAKEPDLVVEQPSG